MSIIVAYNNGRKPVKVANPNASARAVLDDAMAAFNVPEDIRSQCVLRYKKIPVDLSLSWRFCNIPSNSTLDLEVKPSASASASATAAGTPQAQAGAVGTPGSGASTSAAATSPAAVITTKIALAVDRSGGSVLTSCPSSCTISDMLHDLISVGKLAPPPLGGDSEIIFLGNRLGSASYGSTTFAALGLSGQSIRMQYRYLGVSPAVPATSPRSAPEVTNKGFNDDQKDGLPVPPVASILCQPQMALVAAAVTTHEASELLSKIVASNSGKHSLETLHRCLATLSKYLENVLDSSEGSTGPENRARSINLNNKAFTERVASVEGAVRVLHLAGFEESADKQQLVLSESQGVLGNTRTVLGEVKQMLTAAAQSMAASAASASASSPQSSSFDPFKSTIVRTQAQPTRAGPSAVDAKLDLLNKRRRELEGDPAAVSRCTQALMPNTDGSTPSLQSFISEGETTITNVSDADEEREDRRLMNRVMAQRIKSSSMNHPDGPPLVTKAIRDLQKAESEKVYSRVLIRVRFPDRVCLQGFFHPRHTMSDVYNWVTGCLASSPADMGFELYTSPPRTVVPPTTPEPLLDLQMAPAALIHLAWKRSSGSDISGAGGVGSYLSEELLMQADGKPGTSFAVSGDVAGGKSTTMYPKGEPLVATAKASEGIAVVGKIEAAADRSADDKGDSKSAGKPKWFKL